MSIRVKGIEGRRISKLDHVDALSVHLLAFVQLFINLSEQIRRRSDERSTISKPGYSIAKSRLPRHKWYNCRSMIILRCCFTVHNILISHAKTSLLSHCKWFFVVNISVVTAGQFDILCKWVVGWVRPKTCLLLGFVDIRTCLIEIVSWLLGCCPVISLELLLVWCVVWHWLTVECDRNFMFLLAVLRQPVQSWADWWPVWLVVAELELSWKWVGYCVWMAVLTHWCGIDACVVAEFLFAYTFPCRLYCFYHAGFLVIAQTYLQLLFTFSLLLRG